MIKTPCRRASLVGVAVIFALVFLVHSPTAFAASRQRLIVLTDIENEPDDTMSMVRLILYSDVIDIQGLIATTSTHLRTSVSPDSIRNVIAAYGKVRGNLLEHDPNYPAAELLYRIRATGSEAEAKRLIARLRVYTISDQDDSAIWIRKNFPDLFYIVSQAAT